MRGPLFSFVCATVRNHLRSRAPEPPGFSYYDLPAPTLALY